MVQQAQFVPRLNAAGNTAANRVKLAHALFTDGQYEAALAEVEAALRDNPESAEGQLIKGLTLARQGKLRAALAPLHMASEFGEETWIACFTLATVYLRLDEHAQALAIGEKLVALDPGDAQAESLRGEALSRLGRTEEAMTAFRLATRLDPSLTAAHLRLGELCSDAQDWSASALELTAAVELAPTDPRAMRGLAIALRGLGRSGEAVQVCRRALHCTSPKPELFLTMAECYLDEKMLFDAIVSARVALMLDPKSPAPHRMMSRLFIAQGRAAEAARHAETAERLGASETPAEASL
jgi:tetratricopeptide (TPR) repeat protein